MVDYDEAATNMIRLGLTKSGQGARIEAVARSIPTLIVPGKQQLVRPMYCIWLTSSRRWIRRCIARSRRKGSYKAKQYRQEVQVVIQCENKTLKAEHGRQPSYISLFEIFAGYFNCFLSRAWKFWGWYTFENCISIFHKGFRIDFSGEK